MPQGFEEGWARYMIAKQRALVARAEGILAQALAKELAGESREELDRIAQEDQRLAKEGLVELRDEAGESYHKHIDELDQWDVADRLPDLKEDNGLGFCNITKCCTEVCPVDIHITDNSIIPLKERVADEFYDPAKWLMRKIRGR
jgi:hypothetical protein